MIEKIRQRLSQLHETAPESVGDLLRLQPLEYDEQRQEILFAGKTEAWMRNPQGTLHGGMCATIADQAMGAVAYCVKPGEGIAPAIELHLNYHRPLIPGEGVLILVRVVSVTKSLIHVAAALFRETEPDKLCVSSTATYFYKALER